MKPSRREFMGMMAASPILLGMQDKAGTKAPVLGARSAPLRGDSRLGHAAAQIKWGNTHGVVEDSQGNIYVHHTVHATSDSADTVVVFDANGKFVRSWGKEFAASRTVSNPQGRQRRVPLPDSQRREPEDDAAA